MAPQASVRCFGGVPKTDDAGLKLIFDGKQTIVALKELQEIWMDDDKRDSYEWSESLQKALDIGCDMSFVRLPTDDDDKCLAYCVGIHHEDNNKFKPSTLRSTSRS